MNIMDIKVGSGFAFLLYYALVIGYALITHAPFAEVAPWLAAGAGGQIGQRTFTQVALGKAESKVAVAKAQAVTAIAKAETATATPCPDQGAKS